MKRSTRKEIKNWIVLITVILLAGFVGYLDRQDDQYNHSPIDSVSAKTP